MTTRGHRKTDRSFVLDIDTYAAELARTAPLLKPDQVDELKQLVKSSGAAPLAIGCVTARHPSGSAARRTVRGELH